MAGLASATVITCLGTELEVLDPDQVAMEFSQRSWQYEHGLPMGDRVWALLQTRDGYLWIGTQHGLARFDGRKFTGFDHVNTPALQAGDDCRTLAEDLEGNLWIGTQADLVRNTGNQFTSFRERLGIDYTFRSYPPLCASRDGGIWVGGLGGDSICRIRNETVQRFPQAKPQLLAVGNVTCLEEDEAGFLWIGWDTGFGRFDIQRQQLEYFEPPSMFENIPVFDMWSTPGGERWVLFAEFVPRPMDAGPKTWIACIEPGRWPKGPSLRHDWFGSVWVGRFIVGDREGALWLPGAVGGIQRYRGGNVEFLPMEHRSKDDFALSALFDREGNLWIGTDTSGLHCWTPRTFAMLTVADGLPDENVWSIFEASDGSVLVGTDGGVVRFTGERAVTMIRADGSVDKDVRAVLEDQGREVWVGTMRSLDRIRNGTNEPIILPGEWFEAKIRALCPGRDGSVWVGTVRGLHRFYQNERSKYTKADGLGSDEVRAILEDREGVLWIGTLGGGLSCLKERRLVTFSTTNGLASQNVWALHEDPDGLLWAGTDNGLSFIHDGRITSFTKAQGLPESAVNFIISDDYGRLWIGHDRGIYSLERRQLQEVARKHRASLSPVSYDESDGLASIETNGQKSYPAACKTRDGRIWFPTTKGVAILDPARVGRSEIPPLAAVEEVRANGLTVAGQGASSTPFVGAGQRGHQSESMLHLPPGGARVLDFFYTANTFVAPEKVRFRYRLVGLDANWIDVGTRRQVSFTDLDPGNYRFEVRACNHHGLWQSDNAFVSFYVTPFYYQTWWFYTVCLATALGLLGIVAAWRLRELRRIYELERVNALNEQRRRIARDIHDELGASLTHILHLSEAGSASWDQPDAPSSRAERIAAIASEAVDDLGEIVWANNPEFDTLEDLVAYLREHAASYFAETEVKVSLDFPETVPARTVTGLFRRHLVLVMKEALQNVTKHANARQVHIRLTLRETGLEWSVRDNGRGLPPENLRPSGNGLANMRHRVSELNGILEIESMPGGGTEVRGAVPWKEI